MLSFLDKSRTLMLNSLRNLYHFSYYLHMIDFIIVDVHEKKGTRERRNLHLSEEENIRSFNSDSLTSGNPLLDLKILSVLAKDIVFFLLRTKFIY